jgi:predicted phage terminase large subunit-like protein
MADVDQFSAVMRHSLFAFVMRCFYQLNPADQFQTNWHIRHLCWQLERVKRGEIKRLIINIPPRNLKSILTSVSFSAWFLGHDPTKRIMCVSYAEELARQLSLDTRAVMQSDWFKRTFPNFGFGPRQRVMQLETSKRGWREAFGAGGSIMGKGADLIIVDDPIKAMDALSRSQRLRVQNFYDAQLYTRLNDKSAGAIVIIMQRLHQDDLVGHVLARDDWTVVSIPAIAEEKATFQLSADPGDIYVRPAGNVLHEAREPLEVLEAARRTMGSMMFAAQYQQNPVPAGGNAIKREWLKYYATRPARFDRVVVSWDTASTLGENSDYSVGTAWGAIGLDFYVLDVVRARLETPELCRQIVQLSERWKAHATLIENTELGRATQQVLRSTMRVLLPRPNFDKESRLLAQAPRFEAGQVHLPQEAPWLAEYVSELLAFPNGKHDDQVDSTSQALRYLTRSVQAAAPLVRRDIVRRDFQRRSVIPSRQAERI